MTACKRSPSEARSTSELSRRDCLQWKTIASFFSILALNQSCKTTQQKHGRTPTQTLTSPKVKTPLVDDPTDKVVIDPIKEKLPCAPNVDLKSIPNAGPNLETQFVCYGDSTSALLVIKLPNYAHGNLKSITLVTSSSTGTRFVASRSLDIGSDLTDKLTLFPITFDNIAFKTDKNITFLYELQGGSFKKYQALYDISYQSKFKDKPVFGISSTSVSKNYVTSAAKPTIIPEIDPQSKNLQVGEFINPPRNTLFTLEGIEDCYITDLFGDLLASPGGDFHNVATYPEFICYKPSEDGYIRSLIRVF